MSEPPTPTDPGGIEFVDPPKPDTLIRLSGQIGDALPTQEPPQAPQAPTAPPIALPPPPAPRREDRLSQLAAKRRGRTLRSYIMGLVVGALVVVGLNLGLPQLARLVPERVRFDAQRLPLFIFVGVMTGIALTAAVIALLLFFAGIASIFRGGSPWRGLKRIVLAVLSIAITTGVLGGTAFLFIPKPRWKGVPAEVRAMGEEAWAKLREALKPTPAPPKSP